MYDLVIIGLGPAGLSAAIYASRYRLNFLVLGREIGGQVNENHKIDNYLGFPGISGHELGQKFFDHARQLGAAIEMDSVEKIEKQGNIFLVSTPKMTYKTITVIFALGSRYRRLNIPGERELLGKGVSYCATCDGPFFRDKKVAIIGGGNSAASAALLLDQHAREVLLLYRGEELKCDPAYLDQLKSNGKIRIGCCLNAKEIKGHNSVNSIVLDAPFEGNNEVDVQGIFIEIGSEPSVELLVPLGVKMDQKHFIITNQDQSTNIQGIFAAGDITTNSNRFRQIVTAASEGAVAAASVFEKVKATKTSNFKVAD